MKMKSTSIMVKEHLCSILKKISFTGLLLMAAVLAHAGRTPVTVNKLNNLSLGGAIWAESDNNGMKYTRFDGVYLMDAGLIGVTVRLYADTNNDGIADGPVLATVITNNYGQYTFSGLAQGNYVVGVQRPLNLVIAPVTVLNDPDNNIDQDNNGAIYTFSQELRSLAITLTSGCEPTYDGDDANSNRTLDFAFDVFIGVDNYYGYCTVQSSTVTAPKYGYAITASQENTSYPPTYFTYAYQYKNSAGNWICFADGLNVLNGIQVIVQGAKGSSISSVRSSFPGIIGNIPPLNFSPANNMNKVPYTALQGLVTRCVLSRGQNANACTAPANNSINSGQFSFDYTINADCLQSIGQKSPGRVETGSTFSADNVTTGVRVFPNPSAGPVQLEFTGLRGNYKVSVFDLSGRMVSTDKITVVSAKQYYLLNRRSLNPGNYLLQVRDLASGKLVESRQVLLQ